MDRTISSNSQLVRTHSSLYVAVLREEVAPLLSFILTFMEFMKLPVIESRTDLENDLEPTVALAAVSSLDIADSDLEFYLNPKLADRNIIENREVLFWKNFTVVLLYHTTRCLQYLHCCLFFEAASARY